MRARVLAALAVGLLTAGLLASFSASARELCVVCSGPDAVYRCVASKVEGDLTPPSPLVCMQSLARAGGHERCAIRRGTSGCEGREHVLGDDQDAERAVPRTALKGEEPPTEPPQPKATPGEPKTVKELAERAAQGSGEQLRKAGDAVGKATRRTWDCVTSLFSTC